MYAGLLVGINAFQIQTPSAGEEKNCVRQVNKIMGVSKREPVGHSLYNNQSLKVFLENTHSCA